MTATMGTSHDDHKESALDGLYHEAENPNWLKYDNSVEKMIIHIYDAPPHGHWAESGSDPERHASSGSEKHKCCCCSDICPYSKKRGKGW